MTINDNKKQKFIRYLPQQICSRSLFEDEQQSVTLYTMDADESISEEKNDGASLYVILDGNLQINLIDLDGMKLQLQAGQAIYISSELCHSLLASKQCAYIKLQGGNIMNNNPIINKLPHNEVINLADSIEYVPDQVTSKTIVQRPELGITLFAVDAGQQIRKHITAGDALAQIIDGVAEIEIGDELHTVPAGQSIVMPANIPHALFGKQAFKMLLIVVKAQKV